jgi:hypothetical protein
LIVTVATIVSTLPVPEPHCQPSRAGPVQKKHQKRQAPKLRSLRNYIVSLWNVLSTSPFYHTEAMPRKYMTPANRTVIFTGFREGLGLSALHEFCHKCLSSDPSLSSGLVDQGISVASGKVYINFKDCVAARRGREVLSKLSADEICCPGSQIEIWIKDQGRSCSVSSLISPEKKGVAQPSKIPEGTTNEDSQRLSKHINDDESFKQHCMPHAKSDRSREFISINHSVH